MAISGITPSGLTQQPLQSPLGSLAALTRQPVDLADQANRLRNILAGSARVLLASEGTGEVNNILEQVIKIVDDKIPNLGKEINMDTPLKKLGLDSLGVVEFVMDLESQFEIRIPQEELEEFKTIGDVVNYIPTAPKAE